MGQDFRHVGLQNHASDADLLQNVVHLVHMEDEVQFTDILKTPVQRLHKHLYNIRWREKIIMAHNMTLGKTERERVEETGLYEIKDS